MTATALAIFAQWAEATDAVGGLAVGGVMGVAVAFIGVMDGLFARTQPGALVVGGVYHVLQFVVAGVIIGAWP